MNADQVLNCLSDIDTDYSTDSDSSIGDDISTDSDASIAVNQFDTGTASTSRGTSISTRGRSRRFRGRRCTGVVASSSDQGWTEIQGKQNSSLTYK